MTLVHARGARPMAPRRLTNTRVSRDSHRGALLVATVVLASMPLGVLVGISPVPLALADLAALILLPTMIRSIGKVPGARLFCFLVSASAAIILMRAMFQDEFDLSPAFSMVFFFKPWIIYFATWQLIRVDRATSSRRLLYWISNAHLGTLGIICLARVVTGTLIETGGTAEDMAVVGFSAGSWNFPIQLYAYGQVNTTAAILVVALGTFLWRFKEASGWAKCGWLIVVLVDSLVVVMSGSRGAMLSIAILLLVSVARSVMVNGGDGVRVLFVFSLALTLLVLPLAVTSVLDASPRYRMTIQELGSGTSLVEAAGRSELFEIMVHDIERSPLVGTAFSDFANSDTPNADMWRDSSPHSTYIGAVHKMGIPLGVIYLCFMILVSLRSHRAADQFRSWSLGTALGIPMWFVLMPFMDVLTTPALAANIMVIWAAFDGEKTSLAEISREKGDASQENSL